MSAWYATNVLIWFGLGKLNSKLTGASSGLEKGNSCKGKETIIKQNYTKTL